MKTLIIFGLMLGTVALGVAETKRVQESFALPSDAIKDQSRMCTAFTGAKLARYDQCVASSEVMVGIRSLDPLVVLCSPLTVNCYRSQPEQTEQMK